MNVIIKSADKEDLAEILQLQRLCYQTEANLYNNYNIKPLIQSIDSIQLEYSEGTYFLKGIIGGKIISSVRGIIVDKTTYIGRLIVHPEYQNKRIGQSMMKEIENQLKDCLRYELFTGNKSEKNLKLYEKLGYHQFKEEVINKDLKLIYLEKKSRNTFLNLSKMRSLI